MVGTEVVPMGVGGYVFNDVAGRIKRSGVSGAVCYGLKFGDLGKLGFGVSGGFYSFRLDTPKPNLPKSPNFSP